MTNNAPPLPGITPVNILTLLFSFVELRKHEEVVTKKAELTARSVWAAMALIAPKPHHTAPFVMNSGNVIEVGLNPLLPSRDRGKEMFKIFMVWRYLNIYADRSMRMNVVLRVGLTVGYMR